MIKRIVEFFRRLYLKWFCDVAVDLSDGKDCTGIVHYRKSRSGHVTIHDVNTIPPCENSFFHQVYTVDEVTNCKSEQVKANMIQIARRSGKSITVYVWQYLKNGYPHVYHLSKYARKRKVRKKNVHRISKVVWEIMND